MNDTTAYLIVSAICGLILAGMKVCYDSKCVRIKCGCLEIERDIIEESHIETRASPPRVPHSDAV